jgi:hypothetical protein
MWQLPGRRRWAPICDLQGRAKTSRRLSQTWFCTTDTPKAPSEMTWAPSSPQTWHTGSLYFCLYM